MLEKFLQRKNLFVLIDYIVVVIDYNKLSKAERVKSRIGLIDYDSILIDYSVIWDNDWFFRSLPFNRLPGGLTDYFYLL